ncbi:hypothetical protein LUCX_178 [Xanthomonas phage vB_XciM_LucasX]|nr:hypothetical protein LUCX_178 [Xanthomonas phage vB_XciM_LucasX]
MSDVDFSQGSKSLLVQLINNLKQTTYTEQDLLFGQPAPVVGDSYNTVVRVQYPDHYAEQAYYTRLDLERLFETLDMSFVDPENLVETQDVLDLINQRFGFSLGVEDVSLSQLDFGNIQHPAQVTMTALSSSLAYIGQSALTLTALSDFVPLENLVILGASLEDYALSPAANKTAFLDRVEAATGFRPGLLELADGGARTSNLRANIATKIAAIKAAGFPSNKSTKVWIGSIIGNDVTDRRPYTSAQESTYVASVKADLNYIWDQLEAEGYDVMLSDATFRDYDNTTYANEAAGSLPYNEHIIDVINAARGKYLFAGTNKPWSESYPLTYNNNVIWLQPDNIHNLPAGVTGYWRHIADTVAIPGRTGVAPARIAKNPYIPRPAATIAVVNTPVAENGALQYTVTLDAAVPWPCRVTLQYSGTATVGTDYVAGPSEVTIPANQTSTTFSVQGLADGAADGDKTLIVSVNTTGDGYVRGATFSATGTYTDAGDTSPPVDSFDVGDKIRASFGLSSKASTPGVNKVATNSSGSDRPIGSVLLSNALTTAGEPTGVVLTLTNRDTRGSYFGGSADGGTDRHYEPDIYANDLSGFAYIRGSVPVRMQFSGLAPGGAYRVVLASLRADTNMSATNRITNVAVTKGSGTGGSYDAASAKTAGTNQWRFEQTDWTPNSSGELEFALTSSGSDSTIYAYLSILVLERIG